MDNKKHYTNMKNFFKTIGKSTMFLAMMAVVCLTGFTSCSDDETIGDNAPYTGLYKFYQAEFKVDGKSMVLSSQEFGMESELNFKEDGTYTALTKATSLGTEQTQTEEGTWNYNKNNKQVTFVSTLINGIPYEQTLSAKVTTWTENAYTVSQTLNGQNVKMFYKK